MVREKRTNLVHFTQTERVLYRMPANVCECLFAHVFDAHNTNCVAYEIRQYLCISFRRTEALDARVELMRVCVRCVRAYVCRFWADGCC